LVGARLETPRLLAPQVLALPATHDPDAGGARVTLVLEANGAESNLLLLDGEGRLAVALRHPALPGRPLAPGDPYVPPVKPRPLAGWALGLWREEAWRLGGDEARARDLDAEARGREAKASLEALRRVATRAANAEIKKLWRRAEHLRADLERAEGADQLRRWGELLKIHRARLRSGLSEIALPDEFDPARPEVTIPLDARLGPTGNIERLFQRHRKLRVAVSHIRRRLEETKAALGGWEDALGDQGVIARAEGREAIEALFRRLGRPLPAPAMPCESGAPRPNRQGAGRGTRPEDSHVLTRTSSDGLTILVGRSKEANDRVTFRLGNGRDWWFHAQGIPGAHVIVRNPGGGPLPERTLREAAWLAAYYSQRRQEGKLDVDYVQRKHVRKIMGGEPGQVTYAHNQTVLVDLSDKRAAAVLGEADG
jgi:predicted ribosome quality control (RQC) complex YloA/Tae2 family protein